MTTARSHPLTDGEHYDLVIVGSGAGACCAALVAQKAGRRAIILEKEDKVGGSTALSGGVLWVPDNPVARREGLGDSFDLSMTYVNACAGEPAPGTTPARRAAYVKDSPRAIEFLESLGVPFVIPRGFSDYHEGELPGALPEGRSLMVKTYDLRDLGSAADLLLRPAPPGDIPATVPEAMQIALCGKTLKSKLAYLQVGLRILQNKLGRKLATMGGALQGRLLRATLDAGVPILTGAEVMRLLVADGKVTGVEVLHEGRTLTLNADAGVLLNAGGFAHNAAMREAYQEAPTSTGWTYASAGDTGEMIEEAKRLGAATYNMHLSVWVTSSLLPDGAPVFTVADMSKPHAILVDQGGERYVNESTSYVKVGLTMYQRNRTVPAIPSWIILDRQHRATYFLAGSPKGKTPQAWRDAGVLISADTLPELAQKCGLPVEGLGATVERFNEFARAGVDRDFGRGGSKLGAFSGDPTRPNPNLGPIERPPFYAIRAIPGDVGTYGGVVADEHARVLRPDGSVIEGLYATGACTAPVFGASYPGGGATIGPALVFGFTAAQHALGASRAQPI